MLLYNVLRIILIYSSIIIMIQSFTLLDGRTLPYDHTILFPLMHSLHSQWTADISLIFCECCHAQ